MAEGIRHGVHHYEAMGLFYPFHTFPFGVVFNQATRAGSRSDPAFVLSHVHLMMAGHGR
jgi:hypothetical protein